MRAHKEILENGGVELTRQDLIDHELAIKDALRELVPFSSYSLFFPHGDETADDVQAEYDPGTRELNLPLVLKGRLMARFIARDARVPAPKTLPRFLAAIAEAELEKLLLHKRSITDALTGLRTRAHLIDAATKEIEKIQDGLLPQPGGPGEPEPAFSGSLGVILLDLDCFQWINENYGYLVGDEIAAEVGRLLRLVSPKHVIPARMVHDSYAVLVPDATPRACFQLAEVFRTAIAKLSFEDKVSGDRISVTASLGYATYPHNISGPQFKRTANELARILVRKAYKAVSTAKYHGRNRVFAYSDILKKGGKVLEVLPMQRLAVSLGRSVDAQVGQRFLVSPAKSGDTAEMRLTGSERIVGRYPEMYKAEVVLTEVQEELAFAEVLHLADPAWKLDEGDRLVMIQESRSFFDERAEQEDAPSSPDSRTGLYDYSGFLARWGEIRSKAERFTLALIRTVEHAREHGGNFQRYMDAQTAKVAEMVRGEFEGVVGGRYGLGGMLFHLPESDPETLRERFTDIVLKARERLDLELAVGLAPYPFLSCERSDMLENSRKALDHALLLESPQVAVFDSVSLNISADSLFMDGDLYGALDEYKLSLLADEDNTLARISMGICLAQLGKLDQAARQFKIVLETHPDDIMALYNLGWASQRLGEYESARSAYERCLKLDPDHVFSLIRLGSLAEREGKLAEARDRYVEASQLPGGEPLVMRHLARVALAMGENEDAREYLHLALNANHNDARAMHMLAKLYLATDEDPQIAEVLARQSSALLPDRPEYWDVLAQALRAQGKDEEADRVAARAG